MERKRLAKTDTYLLLAFVTFVVILFTAWNRQAIGLMFSSTFFTLFALSFVEHMTEDYYKQGVQDGKTTKENGND